MTFVTRIATAGILLALLIACDGSQQHTADAGKAPAPSGPSTPADAGVAPDHPDAFATFAGALARDSGLTETSDQTEFIFFQGCGKQPPRPTGSLVFGSPRDRQEAHDKWDNWEKCVETKARECCSAAVLQETSDSQRNRVQRPKRKLQ
jgi:hypothetical protein